MGAYAICKTLEKVNNEWIKLSLEQQLCKFISLLYENLASKYNNDIPYLLG